MAIEEQQQRLLAWEGLLNARDLGGYPTADGRATRWGAVVRSDSPSELTEAGRAALLDHGIRYMVDLRMPSEIERYPNPFSEPGPHGVGYVNIMFEDPTAVPSTTFTTLAEGYKSKLDHTMPTVANILRAIAEAPEGGVLVHCMAGKDRTGLVAALLLELAGVPRRTVAEDYALTAEYLKPWDERYLESGPGERSDREKEIEKYRPRVEVMLEVLEHLDERYGGAEGYVLESGVSAEDIARLHKRLVGE
jgi:protein-tyrosine phosphatase